MRDFDKWAASLIIVDEEAFLPEEVDLVPDCERPIRTCRVCGAVYIRSKYSQHAEQNHNDGRRVRDRERSRRRYAARRAA